MQSTNPLAHGFAAPSFLTNNAAPLAPTFGGINPGINGVVGSFSLNKPAVISTTPVETEYSKAMTASHLDAVKIFLIPALIAGLKTKFNIDVTAEMLMEILRGPRPVGTSMIMNPPIMAGVTMTPTNPATTPAKKPKSAPYTFPLNKEGRYCEYKPRSSVNGEKKSCTTLAAEGWNHCNLHLTNKTVEKIYEKAGRALPNASAGGGNFMAQNGINNMLAMKPAATGFGANGLPAPTAQFGFQANKLPTPGAFQPGVNQQANFNTGPQVGVNPMQNGVNPMQHGVNPMQHANVAPQAIVNNNGLTIGNISCDPIEGRNDLFHNKTYNWIVLYNKDMERPMVVGIMDNNTPRWLNEHDLKILNVYSAQLAISPEAIEPNLRQAQFAKPAPVTVAQQHQNVAQQQLQQHQNVAQQQLHQNVAPVANGNNMAAGTEDERLDGAVAKGDIAVDDGTPEPQEAKIEPVHQAVVGSFQSAHQGVANGLVQHQSPMTNQFVPHQGVANGLVQHQSPMTNQFVPHQGVANGLHGQLGSPVQNTFLAQGQLGGQAPKPLSGINAAMQQQNNMMPALNQLKNQAANVTDMTNKFQQANIQQPRQ